MRRMQSLTFFLQTGDNKISVQPTSAHCYFRNDSNNVVDPAQTIRYVLRMMIKIHLLFTSAQAGAIEFYGL